MHKLIKNQIRLSVRNLVEFILRSGDLDNRHSFQADVEAMQIGSRLHRKIQASMGNDYHSEVSMKCKVPYESVEILLEGRADGVMLNEKQLLVDEIKAVRRDLEQLESPSLVHTAQAVCYAYILTHEEPYLKTYGNVEPVVVQITYCHPETEQVKRFQIPYTFEQLKEEFEGYIREYGKWAQYLYAHRTERGASICGLAFPFEYRPGQRQLVVAAYKAMTKGENLFIQAPTGIGKTLSTLYPAIQAMGQDYADKIFYLTAKTITRTAAVGAIQILREKGLRLSYLVLTSKEKLCFCDQVDCNPVSCPYAKGHFDRVNAAVYEMITHYEEISRELIEQVARKHQVCPFELSLDISYWVDGIICDYNYVFDPHVRLQRFFSDGSQNDYIFLVDEAHNLVERAREMYSADIEKESFLEAKKQYSQFPAVVKLLGSCNRKMLELKRECDDWKLYEGGEGLGAFVLSLERLYEKILHIRETNPQWIASKEASEFFFQVRDFLAVYEQLDNQYQVYAEHTEQGTFVLHLLCVNPSVRLQECCSQGISTILFSATMLPIQYYKELLGEGENAKAIYVNSPFQKEKRLLAIAGDVSTKYSRRNEEEYQKISEYIRTMVRGKKGNYLVFFPSYRFLQEVEAILQEDSELNLMSQGSTMTEAEREQFLASFTNQERPVVGLCVMGGIFSEGIDLQKEALIGVAVVGTGLPQVNPRQEVLKMHYQREGKDGFRFAYLYPGVNKVLQSAGRLIRTAEDYGVILLLDERFLRQEYDALFPVEWFPYTVLNHRNCSRMIEKFWCDLSESMV